MPVGESVALLSGRATQMKKIIFFLQCKPQRWRAKSVILAKSPKRIEIARAWHALSSPARPLPRMCVSAGHRPGSPKSCWELVCCKYYAEWTDQSWYRHLRQWNSHAGFLKVVTCCAFFPVAQAAFPFWGDTGTLEAGQGFRKSPVTDGVPHNPRWLVSLISSYKKVPVVLTDFVLLTRKSLQII